MQPRAKLPQFKMRLPQEIKDWLSGAAKANRRSVNSEIVIRLEESRRREEEKQNG